MVDAMGSLYLARAGVARARCYASRMNPRPPSAPSPSGSPEGAPRRARRWLALTGALLAVGLLLPLWEIPAFLVAKQRCSALRWSALLCPGMKAWADVQIQPPMEGIFAEVYCPSAGSPQELFSSTAWADTRAPASWWHPKPHDASLPFLGSRTVRAPTAQYSSETALWGGAGTGGAMVFDAPGFGPVCGGVEAGWVESPTPEWIRALR